MLRLIAFLAVVIALAAGFSWIAENPGEVHVAWLGYEAHPSIMQLAIGLAALVIATIVLWSFLVGFVNAPAALHDYRQRRRRERGWRALSQGMIAVGAGDPKEAQRLSGEARRILGNEPLAMLLDAQSAQAQGDFRAARTAFEQMLDQPETRLLGLRGLYVEADREGEAEAARHFAEKAHETAPRLAWAGDALISAQAQAGDWEAAIVTLERNQKNRVTERPEGRRLRAVLLTARALELEAGNPETARTLSQEAHSLAPDLVPAALLAARLLVRSGDLRKAGRILETTWKNEPHPDVADAYARLKPGDSTRDRLARARALVRVRGSHPEASLALARAEADARDFNAARAALKPLIETGASRRVCLLMAEIEEAEFGPSSRVREWLTRAVRAPRDAGWIADGMVLDSWQPVTPVSARLDGVTWGILPERGEAGDADVVERLAEVPAPVAAPVPVPAPVAPSALADGETIDDAVVVIPSADDPGPNGDDLGLGRPGGR